MNIASLLTRSAASHGSRIALRQGPSRLTYTELSEQASRFGSGVRALGLPRGARIALYMKNRAEYAIALVGAFRAGLVAVPINVRLHPSELDYIVQHCDARALVHGPDALEAISALKHPLDLSIAVGEHRCGDRRPAGCQPDANELVAHCRLHIASFKKPTRIAFLDSLPKNAYGKVLRRELRDRLISDEHGS